jgi:hypothetical protein
MYCPVAFTVYSRHLAKPSISVYKQSRQSSITSGQRSLSSPMYHLLIPVGQKQSSRLPPPHMTALPPPFGIANAVLVSFLFCLCALLSSPFSEPFSRAFAASLLSQAQC